MDHDHAVVEDRSVDRWPALPAGEPEGLVPNSGFLGKARERLSHAKVTVLCLGLGSTGLFHTLTFSDVIPVLRPRNPHSQFLEDSAEVHGTLPRIYHF